MSVVVLAKFRSDADTLVAMTQARPATFETLAAEVRRHGGVHHRIAARGSEILVIQEWRSVEDFDTFYPDMPGLLHVLGEIGVEDAPEISYWYPVADPGEF